MSLRARPRGDWDEYQRIKITEEAINVKVQDVMTSEVKLAHTGMSVLEAAQVMSDADIGGMPIVEEDNIVGFVTDRDLVLRAVAPGLDLRTTTLGDVMTKDVVKLRADQDIKEAADLMRKEKVRRMIVTNEEDKIAGILSLGDLAARTGAEVDTGKVLDEISSAEPDE